MQSSATDIAAAAQEKRNKDRTRDLTVTLNKAADALIFKNNRKDAEAAFKVLTLMIGNIAENPEEEKYRKVKSRNKMLGSVLHVECFRDFLVLVGGLIKVVNFEEHWVFESNPINNEKISLAAPILKAYQKKLDDFIEKETRQTDRKKQDEETRERTAMQFRDDRAITEERVERERINRLLREKAEKDAEERLKQQNVAVMEREAASRLAPSSETVPVTLVKEEEVLGSQETENDVDDEEEEDED